MQVVIQGVSSITGLLLIRAMDKNEYAWFTLASSMLATLNLLADGGISTALTSIGGRLFQNPPSFSRLFRDGITQGIRMCVLGIVLASPFFCYLFVRVGAPPMVIVGLLLLSMTAIWPVAFTNLLSVAARLHFRTQQLQATELGGAATRLGLTACILWLGCSNALTVVAAAGIAAFFQAWSVWRQTSEFLSPLPSNDSYRGEVGGFVHSLYANHVFFCIQGQIATWLISWLAGVGEMADLGALSRLAVLFSALGAPFVYLVAPSMARIQDMSILRYRFVMALTVALGFTGLMIAAASWQPDLFLWLLGAKYAHLSSELSLAFTAQGASLITGICWGLIVARGWVRHAWVTIVTTVLGFAIGAALFPLGKVWGLLAFSVSSSVPTLMFCLALIGWKLWRGRLSPSKN